MHNEAAGPGHRALNLAIDAYEQYRRQGDPAAVELVEQAIDRLLDGGRADECLKPWLDAETDPAMKRAVSAAMTADRAGGAVSELINEARSYRTQVVAEVSSEARRFSSLMPMYRLTPLLVKERLWRDARQEILTGDVETFYLPDDGGKALLLEINRDPAVRMRREQEKYRRTAADDGGRR